MALGRVAGFCLSRVVISRVTTERDSYNEQVRAGDSML